MQSVKCGIYLAKVDCMEQEKIDQTFKAQILVIDDNPKFVEAMKSILTPEFEVTTAHSAHMGMMKLDKQPFHLVLLDYEMPHTNGEQALPRIIQRYAGTPVIMLTGKSDSDTIIKTMRLGASDYVIKGSEDFESTLKHRITLILDKSALIRQNKKLTAKIDSQKKNIEIVGNSSVTMKLRSDIAKLKGSSAYVFISGENGTGKELIARNLNAQENDPSRPFVAVNCAALTQTLIESELFGHKKGAFTGATEARIGKFQAADGGDIFLDEITEIPIDLQAKLLRVLQEKVFTPIGSNIEKAVDVRVIAATNRNLDEEVAQGRFRADLFYRLNQISIHSPALRERKQDISVLAEEFLKRKMPVARFSNTAIKALLAHSWNGNIRELENTIERATILARDARRPIIMPEHLVLSTTAERPTKKSLFVPELLLPKEEKDISPDGLQDCMDWMERSYLERSLEIMKNDNQATYSKVGMSKAHYFRRKKAIGLVGEDESGTEAMC